MAVLSTLVTSLPSLSHVALYTFLALGVYIILNILNQLVKIVLSSSGQLEMSKKLTWTNVIN